MHRLVVLVVSLAVLVATPLPAGADADNPLPAVAGSGQAGNGRGRALVGAFTQSLGFDVGRIEIPAIGLDERIREGIDIDVINRGPAHWAGTAMPGQPGNMVLAGHRTTWSRPFHDLDRLQHGDDIWVTGIDGVRAHYTVDRTMVVSPAEVWIADPTVSPQLTLFACHPKGSAAQRIVVRAKLATPVVELP